MSWEVVLEAAAPFRLAFEQALQRPREAQNEYLAGLLARNANTEFGRRHDFRNIRSADDFSANVPVCSHEDVAADIERIAHGEENILYAGSTLCIERTSGTSRQAKWIPYNHDLLEGFRAGLFPWLQDVVDRYPSITKGTCYWSISPVTARDQPRDFKVPVGLGNDALYFGEKAAHAIDRTLAVPAAAGTLEDIATWRRATLLYLLCDADLALISIWSPTFLLALLQAIPAEREHLLAHLSGRRQILPAGFPPAKSRPALAELLQDDGPPDSVLLERLWPNLQLISCWEDGASARYAQQLRELFPRVHVQGKGLLSTEGLVSVPWRNAPAPVCAVNSAYLEFRRDDGCVVQLADVEADEVYETILTTGAGLYRYATGDLVEIAGEVTGTPCLRFLGRKGNLSDLCGEKLTEANVADALRDVPGFALLAPEPGKFPGYNLFVDANLIGQEQLAPVVHDVETRLRRNPQYAYARNLGQLRPLEILRVLHPVETYTQHMLANGLALGDIKPALFSVRNDWKDILLVAGSHVSAV